ncbi:MAG TPA: PD-(D/E)XK nuclease family protein [Candidatus Paceibacterota bacterium]|nr:PD-(D/E)XK nuclease family protein [Candidatus Paceibacterota bacterium]
MSSYYKPHRRSDYNYGGPKWTLSRSKIDLFMECARCFYIDNKLGTARPPGFPFNLNSAVDALLKKELDAHRAQGTKHPLAEAYGIDAKPFAHEKIDEWRNALSQGVKYVHPETGLTVRGGVDDIWVNGDDELIVIDYKATSKDGTIESLDEEWHRGYKRQLEVYQWLLRKNGFKVSDMGYWFYANASKDREAFDGRLDFELTLVPYKGNTDWIDGTLIDLKACLDSDALPRPGIDCDYCTYREAVGQVLQPYMPRANAAHTTPSTPAEVPITKSKKIAHENAENSTLF